MKNECIEFFQTSNNFPCGTINCIYIKKRTFYAFPPSSRSSIFSLVSINNQNTDQKHYLHMKNI